MYTINPVTKIGTQLNKNNKYRDQIEYRTLTLTCGTLLGWHAKILKYF